MMSLWFSVPCLLLYAFVVFFAAYGDIKAHGGAVPAMAALIGAGLPPLLALVIYTLAKLSGA